MSEMTNDFGVELEVIYTYMLCNAFRDMNYCPVNFCLVILSQTYGQTKSDAFEPTCA